MDRFMDKVSMEPNSGCWLWTGAQQKFGYGVFREEGRTNRAHRVAYKLFKGEIPATFEIDHLCRIRSCVNPDHLEAVTKLENIRRGNGGMNMKSKTHCPSGHPYNIENTRLYEGRRYCKSCSYENGVRQNAKLKLKRRRAG